MRIRTGFSFRTAVGHLSEVIERVKEIGWEVAPISDRTSTFGFTQWTKLAKKSGLRPIYGVELAVVPELGQNKPRLDFWTFFAKDSLRPLHDLIARATKELPEPCLSYEQALNETQGLVKIAGERVLLDLVKPTKDFYIGLSPSLPKLTYNEAKKRKLRFLATSDNVYPRETDREFYRVALGYRASVQTYPQHIMTDDEWIEACWQFTTADCVRAIDNRNKVFKLCKAEMKSGTLLVPDKPKSLRAMCEDGASTLKVNLSDQIYLERLNRELALIEEKKFEDYFYIIADMINWAKRHMIVGPARGSSCGSLVCYLLGITSIDPIPFGLIFERFIDTTRVDLPDIDIDFSDEHRQLVFYYVEKKYGKERVARLGTTMTFQPKSALKAVAPGLRIPNWQIEKVSDSLLERSSGDSRALMALEDTLNTTEAGQNFLKQFPEAIIAARLEGHPATAGQHAAGVVITQEPIAEYVAIDSRTNSTMCNKKDAEDLNLLKIDALGLTQLSIFERTLELIGKKPVNGFLETLPLDDQKAFDVLNNGHFAGVFQFTGLALQSLTKQVKITHIEDMISITALARPGPLASGGANSWVKRKNGFERIETIHPMLTELTKGTLGVVIYQETVMNIVRVMGKMSWEDTSAIRKAMSGRLGDEFFEGYWKKFRVGALENNVSEVAAKEIWDQINTFGSWAFNRSHAVAYGLVSYWSCWLKAHHPLEFAAATLDAEALPERQIQILRELAQEGIDYVAVDAEHSTARWTPVKKGNRQYLVGPLTAIKGIGPAAVGRILDARKNNVPLEGALAKKLSGAKTDIDTLTPIADRIKQFNLNAIEQKFAEPTPVKEVQSGLKGLVTIFAIAKSIAPRDQNDAQKVARRGKRLSGPTMTLNMFLRDDTDEIFCQIDRFDYDVLAKPIIERGRAGKAIYAVKGLVPHNFRMIRIQNIEFIGFMDGDTNDNGRRTEENISAASP